MRVFLLFSFFVGFQCSVIAQCSTPVITPSGPISLCQGGSATLSTTPTDGSTYQWNLNSAPIAEATSASYIAAAGGSYTVTVAGASDGLGGTCASSTSLATVVTVNAPPTATITTATATTFCQGGSVVLNANTGTGLTYQWYNNAGAVSGATSASYTANASGSYTVVVTNTATCSATSSATVVTVNTLPIATITPATATTFCQGGSVVLNANTGTGLSYQWKLNGTNITGATTSTYTANASGSYTVVVTNSSTCSATSAATVVTVNALPTATITTATATTFCQGGSVVLNANTGTGLTYQWYNNAGAVSGATSASYTATTSGSYTVTVTNASTCSSTSTGTVVTVNALPTSTITPATATTFCQGGSVLLNANTGTGLTHQWRLNGTNITGATSASYTANASGSYAVVVTNTSTCSATSIATVVTVNALPTATITAATATTFCQGGSVVLTANSGTGLTHQWRLNGTNITGATTSSYTANASGSYTVVVTNTNNCSITSSATTVTVNQVPNVTEPNDIIFCSGQVVPIITFVSPLNISGTYFEWENSTPAIGIPANGTNNINSFTSQNLSNSNSIATILVTPKTSFCTGTPQQFSITVKPTPSIPNLQQTICTERSFSFTPENIVNGIVPSNTKLEWTVDYANVIGGSNSLAPIDSISQTLTNSNYSNNQVIYHVTPTANFCPGNTFDYVVTVKKAPNLIVTPTDSLCEGGSIQLFAVDAFSSGQLFYNWSNASTLNNPYIFNPIASPTSNTTYSVSVTDNATQCEVTRNVTVNVEPLPTANILFNGSNIICVGNSVALNTNSFAGLSYQWRLNDVNIPSATTSSFSAASSGVYSVVVTTSNGCTKTSNGQTVIVNPIPIADVSNLSSTTFCQGESVIFNTTNVAGNTYQWKLNGVNIPGADSYSFEADQTGSYSVLVTNANSCSALSPAIDVLVNALPEVSISALDSTLCFGANTTLLASGALAYSWTPAGLVSNSSIANPNVFPTSTTNFGVMGTDLNGCSDYQEIQIVVAPNPSLDLPSSIEACQGSTVSLPGSASIAWTGVTSTNDFDADQSGYAIATLQNSNLCSSIDSIYIQVNLLPVPNISGASSVCANSSYSEYVVNSTGNLFSWNVSNGEFQGIDNGNTAIIHWFDQEYGPSTFVTITEHDIHSGCEGSDTLFVAFTGLAPSSTTVSLLYPNGSTLFSADHYAIMNWGSTIISNNVDEYTDGHAQYYTFDNFDTALRYYWIEAGDDSLCLTRSYFNAPVWQIDVQETTDNSLIRIYPNPTSGVLNLSVDGKNSISSFSIYNCTGHLVKQEFNLKNQIVIDVSDLPSGFYILKANDSRGSNYNQTFIKQ
jgi:hypothetical protein